MALNFRGFFNLDDEYEEPVKDTYEPKAKEVEQPRYDNPRVRRQNVVSMEEKRNLKTEENRKIMLFAPKAYADVKEIADKLLGNQAVIVNFTSIDDGQAKRIVDFLTGAVFAINGEIQRVDDAIFLVTPPNYVIGGEIGSANQLND